MKFDNIEQIRSHVWIGNHMSDAKAFDAVHDFAVRETVPIAERMEALDIASEKGMGIPSKMTEAAYAQYLRELND